MKIKPAVILLAGLSIVPIKKCSKQEISIADRIITKTEYVKNPIRNILIADNFKHDEIDVDGDFVSDIPHGVVVSTIIESGLKKANVIKKNVFTSGSDDNANVINNLKNLFLEVLNKMKTGKFYDAINLSLGFSVGYETLSYEAGMDINTENIEYYSSEIKKKLQKEKDLYLIKSLPMRDLMDVINLMDSITIKGTKIYLAAGNSDDRKFNLLALADNVNVVGASDEKGNPVKFSDKNTLVNRFAMGKVVPKRTKDGVDLTDDGITDIKNKCTTSFLNVVIPLFANFEGTSFAAPRALVKDFRDNKE